MKKVCQTKYTKCGISEDANTNKKMWTNSNRMNSNLIYWNTAGQYIIIYLIRNTLASYDKDKRICQLRKGGELWRFVRVVVSYYQMVSVAGNQLNIIKMTDMVASYRNFEENQTFSFLHCATRHSQSIKSIQDYQSLFHCVSIFF